MWQEKNDKLHQKFTFKDFEEAVDFVNKVAQVANELNHHPEIKIVYNEVELSLSTHDAGNIVTDKDREFAKRIDVALLPANKTAVGKLPKEVKLYGDGGSRGNPGPSAYGFAILDMNDKVLFKKGQYIGITTNNQAEYKAVLFGLEEAKKQGVTRVDVYLDSQLVVNQMNGSYKVRNQDLLPIYNSINDLLKDFESISFTHVPRELNKLADSMVNEALDAQ